MAKQIKEWTNDEMDALLPKAVESIKKMSPEGIDDRLMAILITSWVDGYCTCVEENQPEIEDGNVPDIQTEEQPETELEPNEIWNGPIDSYETEQEVENVTDTETENQTDTGFGKWQ